jgi:curved DNA-binding protein CbpA
MPIVPVETELYDLLGVPPNADDGDASARIWKEKH